MTSGSQVIHPRVAVILVIHVKTFLDREQHMRDELGRFGLPFEFVLDHDAVEITPEIEVEYFDPGCALSKAEKSCCMKHLLAMRRIARLSDDDFGLVLEDDVVLADNFLEILGKAVDEAARLTGPRTIQVGCANNLHVPKHLIRAGSYLYRASQVRATDSYLIDAESARRRIAFIEQHKMDLPADHLFNKTDTACGIPILWLEPTVVEQGSMNGRFQSAICTKRSRRSQASQQFHYHLKKLRTAIFDPLFRRNRKF
jgi:glycosyl transferase, family 25